MRYVTSENLLKANQAAESLLCGTLLTQSESVGDVAALATKEGTGRLRSLMLSQEPHSRCFSKLSIALRAFDREMESRPALADAPDVSENLTRAYLTLKVYHRIIRLFLYRDTDMPEIRTEPTRMAAYYKDIIDLTERILQLGSGPRSSPLPPSPPSSFIPVPSTTQPLFIVVLSGIPQSNRKRAIDLFRRYPRREGLWDTVFAASLSELIMAREREILAERRRREVTGGADDGNAEETGEEAGEGDDGNDGNGDDDEVVVDVLDRQFGTRVSFEGEKRAKVTLCTWREWLASEPGKVCWLEW